MPCPPLKLLGDHDLMPCAHVQVWSAGQQQLLTTIHPDSRHVTLPGADYLTLYTHPQLVASTILHMVGSWRRDSKGNA